MERVTSTTGHQAVSGANIRTHPHAPTRIRCSSDDERARYGGPFRAGSLRFGVEAQPDQTPGLAARTVVALLWNRPLLLDFLYQRGPRGRLRDEALTWLFTRGYRAFNERRPPYQLFDPELEVHQTAEVIGTVGTFRGHAGMTEVMEELWDAFEETELAVERIFERGKWIVVLLQFRARGRESGIEIDREVAHVYRLARGRTVELRSYWDPQEAYDDLRIDPARG